MKTHRKPSFIQQLAYHLRVFESLGTATSVQRKHNARLTMQWLDILRHTARGVVEATLLVNIRAEIASIWSTHTFIETTTMLRLKRVST